MRNRAEDEDAYPVSNLQQKDGLLEGQFKQYSLKKFDIRRSNGYNKDETRAFPLGGERPFVLYSDRIRK